MGNEELTGHEQLALLLYPLLFFEQVAENYALVL